MSGRVPRGSLKRSTLDDHFKREGRKNRALGYAQLLLISCCTRFARQDKAAVFSLVFIKVDDQLIKASGVCFMSDAGDIKHVRDAAFPDG